MTHGAVEEGPQVTAVMAPKQKAISKLGAVVKHGNGWRVRVEISGRKMTGPLRETESEAQADLDRARQCTSRNEMAQCLEELVKTKKEVKEEPADADTDNAAADVSMLEEGFHSAAEDNDLPEEDAEMTHSATEDGVATADVSPAAHAKAASSSRSDVPLPSSAAHPKPAEKASAASVAKLAEDDDAPGARKSTKRKKENVEFHDAENGLPEEEVEMASIS